MSEKLFDQNAPVTQKEDHSKQKIQQLLKKKFDLNPEPERNAETTPRKGASSDAATPAEASIKDENHKPSFDLSAFAVKEKSVALKTPTDFFEIVKDRFCKSNPILFHTPEKTAYLSINTHGYYENIMIDSQEFADWCQHMLIQIDPNGTYKTGFIKKIQAVWSTLARFEGPETPVHVRYARIEDAIYVDLLNDTRQQVKITSQGWRIIENTDSPVKFIRKPGMKAMPEPSDHKGIDAFTELLGNIDQDDKVLLTAFLVGAINPVGPFPILIIKGQKGSGKSFLSKLIKDLIDPSTVPTQTLPSSEQNLVIAATNSWMLNFDNLSGINTRMADAFCRLSTGGGFRTRKLYKNAQEMLFHVARPVIMNGISDVTTRSDFLDRCLLIDMKRFESGSRIREADLGISWEKHKPEIFGGLCNAVSQALANYKTINIKNPPRMSDFAHWVTAAETALGYSQNHFLAVYDRKRRHLDHLAMESIPAAIALYRLIEDRNDNKWTGTATTLLEALEEYASKKTVRSKEWPKAPNALSNQLNRIAPALHENGIMVNFEKSLKRSITVFKETSDPGNPSKNDQSRSADIYKQLKPGMVDSVKEVEAQISEALPLASSKQEQFAQSAHAQSHYEEGEI